MQIVVTSFTSGDVVVLENSCCNDDPTTVGPTTTPAPRFVFTNPSFELDSLAGALANFVTSATGWEITGRAGTFRPPTAAFGSSPLPAPFQGSQVVFVTSDAVVRQVLGNSAIVANGQLDVSFAIGWRADRFIPFPDNVTVSLVSADSNTVLASMTMTEAGLVLSPGVRRSRTLSFTTGFGNPVNGEALAVEIRASGPSNAQAALDAFTAEFDRPITTAAPSTAERTTTEGTTAEPATTADEPTTTAEPAETTVETTAEPTTTTPEPSTAAPPTTTEEILATTTESFAGFPLPFVNPSFELNFINPSVEGANFVQVATGWSLRGNAGTFLPPPQAIQSVAGFFQEPAEGRQV
jgi:hypothetical protein